MAYTMRLVFMGGIFSFGAEYEHVIPFFAPLRSRPAPEDLRQFRCKEGDHHETTESVRGPDGDADRGAGPAGAPSDRGKMDAAKLHPCRATAQERRRLCE